MRYNLYEPDGTEIGFITDEPEFRWELREDAPFRDQIERVIKRSAEYEMVVAGGEEAVEDAVTPPEKDVPIDDYGRVVRVASELPNEASVQVRQADERTKSHIAEDLVQAVEKVRKERVYVEDESEVPEGVEPQEGEQGGVYYDTEQLGDEEDGSEPWSDASFEDLGSVVSDHISEEGLSQLVEELPEDATPESTIDQLSQMMLESDEYSEDDIHELYRDLGEAFGDSNPDDVPDPEDAGVEVPGNIDIESAVDAVAGVLGDKAANALFGDLRAPDSGQAPNPDSYVATAAQRVPREARSELQEAVNNVASGSNGDSSEQEDSSEDESTDSDSSDNEDESDAAKVAQKSLEKKFARMVNERRESVVKVEELQKPELDIENNGTLRKAGENFIQVDDLLMEAFEKQIWQDDLNKAPNMWERDDNVPQFVRSHLKDAIDKTDVLYTEFDNIPHTAALKVHEIIKDQLTDPQGWSVETVTHTLEEEFEGLAKEQAESIARTEIAAVLNKAREIAYDAAKAAQAANRARGITGLPDTEGPTEVPEDEEERKIMYYWAGPEDHRTTKICSETKDEIDSRGGYVTKDELKEILKEKAKKYKDEDGGLPNRVEGFVPHFNCRHTFIREDYQQVT